MGQVITMPNQETANWQGEAVEPRDLWRARGWLCDIYAHPLASPALKQASGEMLVLANELRDKPVALAQLAGAAQALTYVVAAIEERAQAIQDGEYEPTERTPAS